MCTNALVYIGLLAFLCAIAYLARAEIDYPDCGGF